MKKVAVVLFVPILLMVVFTLMPTGVSSAEVLEGYQSTTSFASSGGSQLLYMMQFNLVKDAEYDAKYAGDIGKQIAQLGIDLCEQLGNGGNSSYSDISGRRVGQFRYSTANVGGYRTSEILRQNIVAMLSDSSKTCNISCCGFATFCWERLLTGKSPYGTSCTSTIAQNFQDIIEGDGTVQYIMDHAKPGDLLFYTKTKSTSPPIADPSSRNYEHAELYIGAYSGIDAQGNSYDLDYACAGSNEPSVRRDACIKSLSSTVPTGRYVYLVSLEKWIASGNKPVDNSGQAESIEDILEGGR